MKYVHHADLTCLAQAGSFNAGHFQIERYTFPFTGPEGKEKDSVRHAIKEAIEARENRGVSGGRLHVELDEENPGSGRVVDHVPRWTTSDGVQEKLADKPKGK